jgi:hypothetical protein
VVLWSRAHLTSSVETQADIIFLQEVRYDASFVDPRLAGPSQVSRNVTYV